MLLILGKHIIILLLYSYCTIICNNISVPISDLQYLVLYFKFSTCNRYMNYFRPDVTTISGKDGEVVRQGVTQRQPSYLSLGR